jgi:hypothetical protein
MGVDAEIRFYGSGLQSGSGVIGFAFLDVARNLD